MTPQIGRLLVSAGFVLLALIPIYVYDGPGQGPGAELYGIAMILVYLTLGLVIGRWWVILLAFIPVLLAVPAGIDTQDSDQLPIWFGYLWGTIVLFAPATIIGWLGRAVVNRLVREAPGSDVNS